ncbi:membrane bound O-acyl transferase family-domain-containing protein [Fomitopsis serialis]|uniref:membrane bound O-acyl transferase family-domain-containing protein n=1 Tax=Fomitopsis serialis TaxID=139415 RepID=UPI0020074876|nr:membrane bound O-acyl transferase family-domain-containing protein [Neoantrodia serialis]KAH9915716.1 membrane bound O-acyl transferase family-domain-containing protein [Neoantrodia serialis]
MTIAGRPALPVLPFFLVSQLGHACLIAVSPRWPGRLVGTVALYTFIASAYKFTTGDAQRDYSIGNTIAIQTFSILLLNWLTNPIHDFRHERDDSAPADLSFFRRVWWALCVINSPRGVGWSYEVANTPPRPSEPRWLFVRKICLSAFRWFLFVDLAQSYQRSNQLFSRRDMDLSSQGYLMLPINIVARFGSLVGMIAMQYSLLAAICVALGISLPRDWPGVYGRWSDSYTVRRFWGRTYHQLLRRLTAGIGKACCRALGLQPGTRASSYTQLYVGFAVSGLLHCCGDLMVNPSLFGASFPFFFLQAVAITFEDAVVGIVRRSGVKFPLPLAHIIGYAWAISWLCISAPWQINWTLKAGIIDTNRVPLSLIDRVAPNLVPSVAKLAATIPMYMKVEA